MKKNWLIRTREHEIIGPLSKEKVQTLLKDKKLVEEDELCQGNSFWFYVKEKKFLKEFLEIDIEEDESNQVDEFVLESNSGDEKKMEKGEGVEDSKNESSPSTEVETVADEEKISEDSPRVEDSGSEGDLESLGDKFKLPEGKKSKEVEEVKKSIHDEIQKEIKKEELIESTKKNFIYPVVILILLSGALYFFYYVKFLGGKIPFFSEANAQVEKTEIFEKKKMNRLATYQKTFLT